jgi:hypothetical protein
VDLIARALDCMIRGFDGHQFAEAVITMNNDLEYQRIASQIRSFTVPAVIALSKSIPQLGAHITAYEEQFTGFMGEFLEGPTWEQEEREESGEPEVVEFVKSSKRKAAVVA